jgi:hypothetical protein
MSVPGAAHVSRHGCQGYKEPEMSRRLPNVQRGWIIMKTVITVSIIVGILAAITSLPVSAFNMTEKVVVANSLVLIARTPAGGLAADQRISAMNDRLIPIISYERLTPDRIRLRSIHGQLGLFVGRRMLTTVTHEDAVANGTTIPKLGRVWLHNARMAIPEARPYANMYLTR